MSDLEVLCDAAVALLGEHGRVLDPCVSPSGHVSYDRLLAGTVRVVVWTRGGVVSVVIIILLRVVRGGRIVARVF